MITQTRLQKNHVARISVNQHCSSQGTAAPNHCQSRRFRNKALVVLLLHTVLTLFLSSFSWFTAVVACRAEQESQGGSVVSPPQITRGSKRSISGRFANNAKTTALRSRDWVYSDARKYWEKSFTSPRLLQAENGAAFSEKLLFVADVVSELNLRYYHGSFEACTTKNGDVVTTGPEVDDVDAPLQRTSALPAQQVVGRSSSSCTCDTSKLLEVVTDLKLLLRKALEELEITTAREGEDSGDSSTRDEEQEHQPDQQSNGPLEEKWSRSPEDENHNVELWLHRTTPTVWHLPIDSQFAATASEEDESSARRNRAAYFEEAVRTLFLREFTEGVLDPLLAEISRHTGLVPHEEAILNKNSDRANYKSSPISQDDHDALHFCVHPTESVQAAMKRIAEISQIGLARLHVVQLHFLDKKHEKQDEDHDRVGDGVNKEASKAVAGRSRRSATSTILPPGGQVEAGDHPQVVVEEQQQQYEVHFHSDLGVHRNEIIPNLLRRKILEHEERARRAEPAIVQSQGQRSPRSSTTTTSPSTRRPFRYLEIGIMDGDNAAAVWHMLNEVFAAIAPDGHDQHDKDDGAPSSSHAEKSHDKLFEIHLVDPFANATKSYFEQMEPWSLTEKLQKKRFSKVKFRFAKSPNVHFHAVSSREAWKEFQNHAAEDEEALPDITDGDNVIGDQQYKFDAIFIDGDHSYEETKWDLEHWSKLLVTDRPSILLVHDYSADCVNCEYQVVDAVRDFIVAGDRNTTLALPSEDGKNREDRLPRRNSRKKTILHTAPDVLAWIEN
ncbi:unnamed protein product [Amoebophrya sp. A120]|nr:unnamed protein product [Amoebophrya sp. A120]|eukprot:GSA120T00023924001.1